VERPFELRGCVTDGFVTVRPVVKPPPNMRLTSQFYAKEAGAMTFSAVKNCGIIS